MLLLVGIRTVEIAAEAGDDRQGEAAAVAPRGGIASGSFRIASRTGRRAACSDEGVQRVEFHPFETKERSGIKPPSANPQQ
jgi:hypothetical protein